MTATEGTARWHVVEQVRDALERGGIISYEHMPEWQQLMQEGLAALSLLEQLAEASEDVLGEPRNPEYDLAARQLLAERVAAVRSGRAGA